MDGRIKEDGCDGRFERFLLAIEKGKTLGGIRNVEATHILRESQSTSGGIVEGGKVPEGKRISDRCIEQENKLIRYAIENGCWISMDSIKRDCKGFLGKGAENKVYLDNAGEYVIKIADYNAVNPFETPHGFINNRITLHNTIFPDTFYELIGFNFYEENKFYFVKKQLFIKGTKPTQEEIDKYMKERNFIAAEEESVYISDDFVIHDLYPRNFVKDKNGELYCIDPIIHLNTKDRGYGGNRSYHEI